MLETIQAKDFSTREQIEDYVVKKYGAETSAKDAIISGTTEELKKLHLSPTTVLWGIRCQATNPSNPIPIVKLNRGKIFKSKIESVDINNSQQL